MSFDFCLFSDVALLWFRIDSIGLVNVCCVWVDCYLWFLLFVDVWCACLLVLLFGLLVACYFVVCYCFRVFGLFVSGLLVLVACLDLAFDSVC